MPFHRQVTTCRRGGGPVSKSCPCVHCQLSVCGVCGGGEAALTTDCPGAQISGDRLEEICETNLNYTDARGWHQGDPMERRSPRFEKHGAPNPARDHDCPACRSKRGEDCWIEISLTNPTHEVVTVDNGLTHLARMKIAELPQPAKVAHTPLLRTDAKAPRIVGCTCGWRTPQDATDSDDAIARHVALTKVAPSIDWTANDWTANDRTTDLKHELAQKAIAWVLADRICDDHSIALARLEDEVDARLPKGQAPDEHDCALLGKLEHEQIGFKLADQRAQKCDDEFRQAARKLVEALETQPPHAKEP